MRSPALSENQQDENPQVRIYESSMSEKTRDVSVLECRPLKNG